MTTARVARTEIPGNRWDLLTPPADHRWRPNRSVSICMPVRDPDERFRRTLSALALQTYPMDLVELVVVDDSSDHPVRIDDLDLPFPSRLVRQDVEGFAAGRARHLAATHASGDVLVFLDSDVIPSRNVLESYARWFERCDDVVPFGFCEFVDLTDVGDDDLFHAVASGCDLPRGSVEVDDQHWRESTFSKTEDLTVDSPDMFRTVVGATLAVSADLYRTSGGFRDVGVRGIEDIEFGYRLQNHGALLIPDRDAVHWHQGRRNMSGDRVSALELGRRPYVERLLPVGGFRRAAPEPGPVETVPQIELVVPDESDADPWVERLRSRLDSNTSIRCRSQTADRSAFAFVELDGPVEWTDTVTAGLMEVLVRTGVGTIVMSKAGCPSFFEVVRTRAAAGAGEDSTRAHRREMYGMEVVAWSEIDSAPGLLGEDVLRRLLVSVRQFRRKICRLGSGST